MKRAWVYFVATSTVGCGIIAGIDPLNVDPCYDGCADVTTDVNVDVLGDVHGPDAGKDGASDATDAFDGSDSSPNDGGCPKAGMAHTSAGFCVDTTEVTFAAYQAFVAAKNGDTSGQIPACAGNTSYVPTAVGSGSVPVHDVDYCDAVAYCQWAGKRLCGKIGGGPLPQSSFLDPSTNQWLYACSSGGSQTWPYGNAYVAGDCNTDLDASGPAPVGTYPKCVGGFPGVYDMVGNVWELIDGLDSDAGTTLIFGAGYTTADPTFQCTTGYTVPIDDHASDIGFRCCAP